MTLVTVTAGRFLSHFLGAFALFSPVGDLTFYTERLCLTISGRIIGSDDTALAYPFYMEPPRSSQRGRIFSKGNLEHSLETAFHFALSLRKTGGCGLALGGGCWDVIFDFIIINISSGGYLLKEGGCYANNYRFGRA
ncbi:hypothetical protein EVAR_86400_1 [Eumeta japonica]|uniref:Uncharacterized protein n=1 Tax=Eumeta variegata TaxID=151549 RepID=A0A4C1W8U1_EUMVA|nr:hypothetical protein EVAR_86400_1 [Eumeta japonica]